MITFLRKLFIKDYKAVDDHKVRVRHGILASIGGIIVNLLLFAFKLIIGLLTFSMSIITDAINNLSDLFSCFVNLFGFKVSGKPADKEHPFGHERIEYIAGMIISIIIVGVAILLGYNSIMSLISGESQTSYNMWAFIILGASVFIKLFLGYFYYGLGKAINSVSLKASRLDSFNDAISTSVVMVAAAVQYFMPEWWWLDAGMSALVACFILYSGIKMVIETASPLLGMPADKEFTQKVTADILSYDGVFGVHDLVSHTYGATKIFMTVHVEVDGYADTFVTHELIDKIEKELGDKYGMLLTVHMDPIDTKNTDLPVFKVKMQEILSGIDNGLTFHDLRLTEEEGKTNIIFDVLIPPDCKLSHSFISETVNEKIKELDSDYSVVLTLDNDF